MDTQIQNSTTKKNHYYCVLTKRIKQADESHYQHSFNRNNYSSFIFTLPSNTSLTAFAMSKVISSLNFIFLHSHVNSYFPGYGGYKADTYHPK